MTRETRVRFPIEVLLRVLRRDAYLCHICGQGYDVRDNWEVDHVVPLARGGTNYESNLAPAHRSCNRVKGSL